MTIIQRGEASPQSVHEHQVYKTQATRIPAGHHIARWAIFFLGAFVMALGVAIMVHGGLGTSPISSWPAVMMLATPLTFGQLNILISLLFFLLQIPLLRRRFKPLQLVQLPLCFVFGFFCDFGLQLTSWVQPEGYAQQWLVTVVGAIIMSMGVYIQVQPKVTYLPGEGLVMALAFVSKRSFGTCKQIFDWTLVLISVVCSFAFLHELAGIREGTIFAAFAIGGLTKVYARIHADLRRWWADRAARKA